MARQLAALPKKQFDMYRTKSRVLGSGEHFNLPLAPSINIKEKVTFDPVNHVSMNISINGDCKNDENVDMKNTSDTEVTGAKSKKKKSKKKKKNKPSCVEEQSALTNEEITSKRDKDVSIKQNSSMKNKILDPDQGSSRIATMNRTLVADISTVCSSESHSTNKSRNDRCLDTNKMDLNLNLENKSQDSNHHLSAPPFGFPLSASKLIESAVGLLDHTMENDSSMPINLPSMNTECIETQDSNKQDSQIHKGQNCTSSVDVIPDTYVEFDETAAKHHNESYSNITSKSTDQKPKKKSDTEGETESVDGDVSNLSALEDEGWQSQVRRSHRKKKKELAGRNPRERSQSDQKNKKNFQKDYKTNNFKKQNFKSNVDNRNQNVTCRESHKTGDPNVKEENVLGTLSVKNSEEKDKCLEDSKPTFSYRDALLKTKPKPSEDLQYNSDSGVDVTSVGSCDSAIHSPKLPYEFNLKEAVNFLMKGCGEVAERHKQGKVHHFQETPDFQNQKKQGHRKRGGFSRPRKQNSVNNE